MRVVIILLSLMLGLVLAVVAYMVKPEPRGGQIGSMRGTTSLQQLHDIGELRVMRAEVCTLQHLNRQGERKAFGLLGGDNRSVEVVVPVQIELGVNLKDVVYEKGNDETHIVRVPRVRMVRKTTSFEPEHLVIWKDEGQGFQDVDFLKEAAQQGEQEAEGKFGQLHMDTLAQQQADDVICHIAAALLSVSPEKVEIKHPD